MATTAPFGEYQSILISVDDHGVCCLTLNRPEVHNAFNERMIKDIMQALESVRGNPSVRIVVLQGAGKSFSAGADINWMRRTADYDESQNYDDARRLSAMMDTLYRFPKPTLANVHGNVVGGGVGLVACCDIAIASRNTRFSLSEVKIGLIPAVISPYVVEAIGTRNARRYFLSGERFDADVARRLGLIHQYCEQDDLNGIIQSTVNELLQCAPGAQKITKSLLQGVLTNNIDLQMRNATARMIAEVRASDEGREGTSAFIEKRPPAWREEI